MRRDLDDYNLGRVFNWKKSHRASNTNLTANPNMKPMPLMQCIVDPPGYRSWPSHRPPSFPPHRGQPIYNRPEVRPLPSLLRTCPLTPKPQLIPTKRARSRAIKNLSHNQNTNHNNETSHYHSHSKNDTTKQPNPNAISGTVQDKSNPSSSLSRSTHQDSNPDFTLPVTMPTISVTVEQNKPISSTVPTVRPLSHTRLRVLSSDPNSIVAVEQAPLDQIQQDTGSFLALPPPLADPPSNHGKKKIRRRGKRGGKQRHKPQDQVPKTVKIFNLSTAESSILQRGLNFAPSSLPNSFCLFKDLHLFIRNLTLKRHYNIKTLKATDSNIHPSPVEPISHSETSDSPELSILKELYNMESEDEDEDLFLLTQHLPTSPPVQHSKFRPKSVFNPTHSNGPYLNTFYQVVFTDLQKLCQQTHESHSNHFNLTPLEKTALKQLTNNPDIVVKTADKGGGIVIQNRQDYLAEARRLLSDSNTYLTLRHDPLSTFITEAKTLTEPKTITSFLNKNMHFSIDLIFLPLTSTTFQKYIRASKIPQADP